MMWREGDTVTGADGCEYAEVLIEADTPEEMVEAAIEWVWTLDIPAEDKFELEVEMRNKFIIPESMFTGTGVLQLKKKDFFR